MGNKNEIEEVTCECCSGKHKDRDAKEKKDLMNRLKRIEGQVLYRYSSSGLCYYFRIK